MPYGRSPLDRQAALGTKDLAERFAEIQRQQGKTIGRKQRAMTSHALSCSGDARGQHHVELEGSAA